MLVWQTLVPGSLFSVLAGLQATVAREQLAKSNFRNAVVVLGYWRSGTTLLHQLLCLDARYTYPTTHACVNPHHFLFTEASALARGGASGQRPMDEMEVRSSSPQEDEFALLSLGARSPYEALLIPKILPEALKLTDPRDLSTQEGQRWREVFMSFLGGSIGAWKRAAHDAQIADAWRSRRHSSRTASRCTVRLESVIRMWRKMFETYAPGADSIRRRYP